MTAMDVCDGDFVLPPLGFAGGGERKKTVTLFMGERWTLCTSGIV